jgi:hypothetical protein
MPNSDLAPPYSFLIFGIVFLSVGVVSTCTGVSWARFGRVIHRDKEPSEFWRDVAAGYLCGAFFIGYFLYKVYGL